MNEFASNYLTATRGAFQVISDKENRFSSFIKIIGEILADYETEYVFIKSAQAKYELISSDNKYYCVCDRQIDLYFNAFDAILFRGITEENLIDASVFIACSELFFAGEARMASEFFDHYCAKHCFSTPGYNFAGELARQHFTVFHEIGHTELIRNPNFDEHFRALSNSYFVGLYGQLPIFDPRVENFKTSVEHECAADIYALHAGLQFLTQNDKIVEIGFGGISNYVYCSLQTLVFQWAISEIRKTIKQSLGHHFTPSNEDMLQRIRIVRQAANELALNEIGEQKARAMHSNFQLFLEDFYQPFRSKIPNFLNGLVQTNLPTLKTLDPELDAEEFLQKFEWV